MKQTLLAFAMFSGGMIGVGLFGLPYFLVRAGLVPTVLLGAVVCLLAYILNLGFADLIIRTKGKKHRLPGYVGKYLGRTAHELSVAVSLLGLTGTLLIYLISGGIFLSLLLGPLITIPPGIASLFFFIIVAPFLHREFLRRLPGVQVVILVLFLVTLAVVSAAAINSFSWDNIVLAGRGRNIVFPYGVLLFSFWGTSLVPEVVEITGRNWKKSKRALLLSYLAAAVSYTIFALAVAGVVGRGVSEAALTSLAPKLATGVAALAALFGVLTTLSSFFALGLTLKKTLIMEVGTKRFVAWLITVLAPLALFLAGMRGFVSVIAVVGAVFMGLEGILVLLAYVKSRPEKSPHVSWLHSRGVITAMILLLIVGVAMEIMRTLHVM